MSNDPVWQEALQVIAQEVNERAFRMWFQPAVGLGLSEGAYCVGVGSEFARDWIEGRFLSLIQDALAEVLGEEVPVKIVVVPTLSHSNNGHAPAVFPAGPSVTANGHYSQSAVAAPARTQATNQAVGAGVHADTGGIAPSGAHLLA
ncbi:MAG: DnaA N-terminal domain-containing protein, partial [Anaerolineae bacterium]